MSTGQLDSSYQFKLVLLGDSAVGKSSIVLRFVRKQFFDYQESTIGAAFSTQTVRVDNYSVKFEIWDTAGQERYHSLAPMYYRGASAAIIVFDITSKQSFERAKTWIKELRDQGSHNIVIVLAGNKIDLEKDREVATSEAKQYAQHNDISYMETSAKTNVNINQLFVQIATLIPKVDQGHANEGIVIDPDTFEDDMGKKRGCC